MNNKQTFLKIDNADCKELVNEIEYLLAQLKEQNVLLEKQDKIKFGRYELIIPKNL